MYLTIRDNIQLHTTGGKTLERRYNEKLCNEQPWSSEVIIWILMKSCIMITSQIL